MNIYIALIGWLLLTTIIASCDKKNEYFIFFTNILVLLGLSSFRPLEVGTDTLNYYYNFEYLDVSEIKIFEFGWYVIAYSCKLLFGSYRSFIIAVNLMTYFFLIKAILKRSKNINLSLLIFVLFYCFFQSMNITRQILASTILLFSLTKIEEKKTFFSYVFLATTIHTTSILFFIIYFVKKVSINFTLGIFLIFVSYLLLPRIELLLVDFLSNSIYSLYLSNLEQNTHGISLNLLLHTLLLLLFFKTRKKDNRVFNVFFIGVILANVFGPIEVFGRIAIPFKMCIILLVPELVFFDRKIYNTCLQMFVVTLLLIACIRMLSTNTEGVVPYQF